MIKIGMVGCGWIAGNAHIPVLQQIEDVYIAALYDTKEEAVNMMADRYQIKKRYTSYTEFLEEDIDTVIICTPNKTHYDLAIKALEHGKHVLCEKPIVLSTGELKHIFDLSEKNNLFFMPAFVNRYREDVKLLFQLVQSNHVGKIKAVTGRWIRRNGIPNIGTWFTNKEQAGGGVLIDLGPHIIDICMQIIGTIPKVNQVTECHVKNLVKDRKQKDAQWFKKEIRASYDINVESSIQCKATINENVELEIDLAWESENNGDFTQIVVVGDKGIISLNTLFGFSQDKLWDTKSLIVEYCDKAREHYNFCDDTNNQIQAFYNMDRFFVDHIKAGHPNNSMMYESYPGVKLTELVYAKVINHTQLAI